MRRAPLAALTGGSDNGKARSDGGGCLLCTGITVRGARKTALTQIDIVL